MKVPFTYYLHDDNESGERLDWISQQTGVSIDIDSDLAQKIGRPFEEVTLHCELDTDTGKVTLLNAKL